MLEARMPGTGLDHRGQTELVDAVQTLKQWMLYDAVEQSTWYLDKPENRIVDNLRVVHMGNELSDLFQFVGHLLLKYPGFLGSDLGKILAIGSVDNAA